MILTSPSFSEDWQDIQFEILALPIYGRISLLSVLLHQQQVKNDQACPAMHRMEQTKRAPLEVNYYKTKSIFGRKLSDNLLLYCVFRCCKQSTIVSIILFLTCKAGLSSDTRFVPLKIANFLTKPTSENPNRNSNLKLQPHQ